MKRQSTYFDVYTRFVNEYGRDKQFLKGPKPKGPIEAAMGFIKWVIESPYLLKPGSGRIRRATEDFMMQVKFICRILDIDFQRLSSKKYENQYFFTSLATWTRNYLVELPNQQLTAADERKVQFINWANHRKSPIIIAESHSFKNCVVFGFCGL